MTGSRHGAVYDRRRRMVTAHGIHGDADHLTKLFLVDRAGLASLVEAAMRADAMWRLRLMALRTEMARRGGGRVVRTALRRAGLGVSAFWIWHKSQCLSCFNAASRGSSHSGAQSQLPVFKFVPHCEQRPLQSSLHSGFIGSAR